MELVGRFGSVDMAGLLANQVAIVTGASSGIGRATAVALAEAGADVVLNYFSLPDDAAATAKHIETHFHRKALLFPVDLSDEAAVEQMVNEANTRLGRLDVLVSSAVFSEREPFLSANMGAFKKTLDVSLMGAIYVLRSWGRRVVEQGRGGSAVIVSSPHAKIAFPNCMAYNIAKAGLDMMMMTAATELLPHKVRVNAVYPGWTDTPGERKFLDDASIRKAATGLPLGRLATAEEIARAILFLADPASGYMTGTTLYVDGGLFLPWWSKRGSGDGEL